MHDIFVAEGAPNYRVQKFSSTGQWLLMFGKEVNQGPIHPGNVCTAQNLAEGDLCGAGSSGPGPGEIGEAPFRKENAFVTPPITVDSGGDVWVGDIGKLQSFSADGKFVSEITLPAGFGTTRGLASDTSAVSLSSGDFYVANRRMNQLAQVSPPTSGTYTLSFEKQSTGALAFDATAASVQVALEGLSSIGGGDVVVTRGEEPGSLWVEFVGAFAGRNLPGLSASAGGSVVTLIPGAAGELLKLEADGTVVGRMDVGGSPQAIGLDAGSGDLFVSDQENTRTAGSARLLEFDASGVELESFGGGEVVGKPQGNALGFDDVSKELFVASGASDQESVVQAFELPVAGPLVGGGGVVAKPVKTTSATLSGVLDPEGAGTEYRFEYVTQAQFDAEPAGHGFDHAVSTPVGSLAGDFEEHHVSVVVSGLSGETAYRFRLVAVNANGSGNGESVGETFTTLPAVVVEDEFVSKVSSTAATLGADLDPLGNASEYHFEYIMDAGFEANLEGGREGFEGAVLAPEPDGRVDGVEEGVGVSVHVQSLTPGTGYRYRVVAHNAGGVAAGPAQEFDTQVGGPFVLPDSRRWEMVSPARKFGANLEGIGEDWVIQAAASGDAVTYIATAPTEPEPAGNTKFVQVFSARGPGGWASRDLAIPNAGATGAAVGSGQDYRFFSEDLCTGVVQPSGPFPPEGSPAVLSPLASEQTAFLHENCEAGDPSAACSSECYTPLATGLNTPEGTKFAQGANCNEVKLECGPRFVDANASADHVIVSSRVALTSAPIPAGSVELYEWVAGALSLVSELPSGHPVSGGASIGGASGPVRGAVSVDGSRVFWQSGVGVGAHLFMHDASRGEAGESVQLDVAGKGLGQGPVSPRFQFASSDGSRVFFVDEQKLTANSGAGEGHADLYECAVVEVAGKLTCELADLTPAHNGEVASVQGGALGGASDGSSVYYVTDGVQGEGAGVVHGTCSQNPSAQSTSAPGALCDLWVRRSVGGVWGAAVLVGVLGGEDASDWSPVLGKQPARVSSNGEWLTFMSDRSLTGFDSHDAVLGSDDEEVFLYDAGSDGLVCASCDVTGARPHGVAFRQLEAGGVAGGDAVWPGTAVLAGGVPGWTPLELNSALYGSRVLSGSGRLFFDSSVGLVPGDVNGVEDVYEFEPVGVGGCVPGVSGAGVVFRPGRAFVGVGGVSGVEGAGCVGLVSSGSSAGESGFLDASVSGEDVFFLTSAKLSRADVDTSLDVYDARGCSGVLVCGGGGGSVVPACVTEASCRPAPSPQPEIFGAPSSGTFSGPGNPASSPPVAARPSAGAVRATRLKRALKACHGFRAKGRRVACERSARTRWGPVKKKAAKKAAGMADSGGVVRVGGGFDGA